MADDPQEPATEAPAANPLAGLKIDFGGGGSGTGAPAPPSTNGTANPFGAPIAIVGDAGPTGAAVPNTGGGATAVDARGGGDRKLIIVGSGPAGLTAAIYAARANLEPLVLAGSTPGGQLMLTSEVENYPGFPEGIDGPDLMRRFREQAERFGTTILDVDIDRVDLSRRPFRLWARGNEYRAQSVIIATGASAIWLELESEQRLRGRGVSACATCDGFFFKDREIAVVGGGDSAMEESLYLTKFAKKVHLYHRRPEFRASKIMVERAIEHPKIEIHTNAEIDEVLGTAKVEGLRIRDTVSGETSEVAMEGLFIAIGHRPNTEVFREWLDMDHKGYLEVHDHTRSRIDGVFIAGDVHDHRYRQAVTAAGDGCMAAIDAERWLEAQGITEAATATAW